MIFEYALIALSVVSGLVAFFYDRSSNSGSGIGTLGVGVIALILIGGLGSGVFAYWQSQHAKLIAERNAELEAEQARAQSMLTLQFVDLDRPFDFGHFEMVLQTVVNEHGEPVNPLGGNAIGTFPVSLSPDGAPIGYFEYDPSDMPGQRYEFFRRGDQVGVSRMSQQIDLRTEEFLFPYENDALSAEANATDANFFWGFAGYPAIIQGIQFQDDQLAGLVLAKLQQQYAPIATLIVKGQAENRLLRNHLLDEMFVQMRFVQSHTNALSEQCTRAIYVLLEASEAETQTASTSDDAMSELSFVCSRQDLCISFEIIEPFTVSPCEIAQI